MRDGSVTFFSDLLAQYRAEQVLCLLTVDGQMPEPIRLVCDTVDLVSRGQTFIGLPFGWQRPSDGETQEPGRIVVQNVDRQIGETVRRAKGQLMARLEFVLRSEPDVVLTDYHRLRIVNARVTGIDAVFDLVARRHGNSAWPGTRAIPSICPGLWA